MSFGHTKIDAADLAFSQWIRLRDMMCVRCRSPIQLNAKGLPVSHQNSHFQGRRKEGTRFEPLNCDTLCGGCHGYFTSNPAEHYAWQVQRKGQAVVDKIVLQSNLYHKRDRKSEAMYWRQQLRGILVQ